MAPKYFFNFRQQILGTSTEPCRYVRHSFVAETHLEAMTKWCARPEIQDIPMNRLGVLHVDVTPEN